MELGLRPAASLLGPSVPQTTPPPAPTCPGSPFTCARTLTQALTETAPRPSPPPHPGLGTVLGLRGEEVRRLGSPDSWSPGSRLSSPFSVSPAPQPTVLLKASPALGGGDQLTSRSRHRPHLASNTRAGGAWVAGGRDCEGAPGPE